MGGNGRCAPARQEHSNVRYEGVTADDSVVGNRDEADITRKPCVL